MLTGTYARSMESYNLTSLSKVIKTWPDCRIYIFTYKPNQLTIHQPPATDGAQHAEGRESDQLRRTAKHLPEQTMLRKASSLDALQNSGYKGQTRQL